MLKKLLIATSAVAVSASVSFAGNMGPVYQPYVFQTGPYVGASVGPLVNQMGLPATYTGLQGTLSGGWGMLFGPRFYLAGEVFGGSNINLYNRPLFGSDALSVQQSWYWGVDAIPGFLINEQVLGYVRAGFQQAEFNGVNDESTAWRVGAGAQTNLFGNVDVRGEYIYAQYGNISNGLDLIGRPLSHQVNLGLVYKFV